MAVESFARTLLQMTNYSGHELESYPENTLHDSTSLAAP